MMKSKWMIAPLLLTTLALGACDSNGSNDDSDRILGSFELEVSGDPALNRTIEGVAGFAVEGSGEERMFVIGLADGEGEEADNMVLLSGAGDPATQTYTIVEDSEEAGALIMLATSDEDGKIFVGTSGTYRITSRSGDELKGTISIEAANLMDETETITLNGTFTAARGDVDMM